MSRRFFIMAMFSFGAVISPGTVCRAIKVSGPTDTIRA